MVCPKGFREQGCESPIHAKTDHCTKSDATGHAWFRACSDRLFPAAPGRSPHPSSMGPDESGNVIEQRGDPTSLDFSSGVIHHYLTGEVVELVMNIDGDIIE